ncbi:hypothetical protein DIE19_24070 [Burkholderia sp. Bp9126]|nr:hypothetical protein DIE19_24070 [Burkholderia sp. Bp9126]
MHERPPARVRWSRRSRRPKVAAFRRWILDAARAEGAADMSGGASQTPRQRLPDSSGVKAMFAPHRLPC